MFILLNVADKIKYGIFNKHCEEVLNPKSGQTFRDTVREMIIKKEEPELVSRITGILKQIFHFKSNNTAEKKVLVIDEIDVFFDERFYGELYSPSISFESKNIKDLIKLVWREVKKTKNVSSNSIIQTNEFKAIISEYPQLQKFFQNQVNGMISAAIDPSHSYYIQNNRIVYKVQDIVSHSVSFGY